jgi:hypothetical protein
MALRNGRGAGVPRIDVLPADELPAGRHANTRVEGPSYRGEDGRLAPSNRYLPQGQSRDDVATSRGTSGRARVCRVDGTG